MSADHFRDRYALLSLADGGVLVDLGTGTYSRLNRAGVVVCEALMANEDAAAASVQVARAVRISADEAVGAVADILAALEISGPRRLRPDPFHYGLAPDQAGYVFSVRAEPRFFVSGDGLVVRAADDGGSTPEEAADHLRALAPRLLFLRGAVVIHGSACRHAEGALAFCGDSGAGKTTTARAFAAAGAPLLAEDMLVVASASPLTVYLRAEQAIRRWAQAEAFHLREDPLVDTRGLSAVADGRAIAINEIWFIAAAQRMAGLQDMTPRPLGPTEGALATMASLFLGATSAAEWRRFLELAGDIARSSTTLLEAHMPNGLENLAEAARRYTQSSAW